MVSGILSFVFGEGGSMSTAFGGLDFIIAFFIIIFLILILVSQRITAENLVVFVLIFLLMILKENLFNIPQQYVMMPIIFIVLFVSTYAYYYFNKGAG